MAVGSPASPGPREPRVALHDVSHDELRGILAQLRESLVAHQQWHGALIRALVCGLPGSKHDLSPTAHEECRFGQWYESPAAAKLRHHPGFLALGQEHQRMHQMARLLLLAAGDGNMPPPLDFDNFANSLERLRLELHSLERELEDSLVNHDSLTGAYTRFGILPMLREQRELVKRHVQSCCIAMVDVDAFKAINDLHGHRAGDTVLAAISRYLITHLRPYDKVFRYGGEEFLLCLPYLTLEHGAERLSELNEGLAALLIDVGGRQPIHVSASIGLVLLDPEVPVETSIDRADQAMYAAKAAGRNCVRLWKAGA